MRSWTSALLILLMFMALFISELLSAVPSVKVNRLGSATLPCYHKCSGSVRWSVIHKQGDLAGCETSCWSNEGYQMTWDQYRNGDLSLTITVVDFSDRGLYTCRCDGQHICDVKLLVNALNTTVQIEPGEPLVLDLDIPEEVEVIYNSTDPAGPSSGQICTVDGRSLQCKPEYSQRVSAAVTLRGVTPSDSGVYTIMDKRNEEVIHTYTVSVRSAGGGELTDARLDRDTDRGAAVPVWVTVLLLVGLVAVIVGSVVVILLQRREIQQLRTKNQDVELNKYSDHSPDKETAPLET